MLPKFAPRKAAGQSLPLIAMMMVIIIGMVALSVDFGNAYVKRRNVIRAANAAALVGMESLLAGKKDVDIGLTLKQSLESNGLKVLDDPNAVPKAGETAIKAIYLDENGSPLMSCSVGQCTSVPKGAAFMKIEVTSALGTYFAQAMGQSLITIRSLTYGAKCTPVQGVYPIAIKASEFGDNGLNAPTCPSSKFEGSCKQGAFGVYVDKQYFQTVTQRRFYLRKPTEGDDFANSFSLLRWKANMNPAEMEGMFNAAGSLEKGFEEVIKKSASNPSGWPDTDFTDLPKDKEGNSVYPFYPSQINPRDWVYSIGSGWDRSKIIETLKYHVEQRTKMILPIYVRSNHQTEQSLAYYVDSFGYFYMRDVGLEGNDLWVDLAYLGRANETPCLRTELPTSDLLGLVGSISLKPVQAYIPPKEDPAAYLVIMDVSGSMSWDFSGNGTFNGEDVQCEKQDPNSTMRFKDSCSGSDEPWRNEDERRIYVAKNAILDLFDRMGTEDRLRIVAFSSDPAIKGIYPTEGQGWAGKGDPLLINEIRNKIRDVGSYNGDSYLTTGGTASPEAFYKALQLLKASDKPDEKYRRVVIFITDGVANFFLNGKANVPPQDKCQDLGARSGNIAWCQIDQDKKYPVTQMIDLSVTMQKEIDGLVVYVLAMGKNLDTDGLSDVASDPKKTFFPVTTSEESLSALSDIQSKVQNGDCVSKPSDNWLDQITTDHAPDIGKFNSSTPKPEPPLPNSSTYGYVYLYDKNGSPLSAGKDVVPIEHDARTGKLGFNLPPENGLTPGIYKLKAYVVYKGDDDEQRVYSTIVDPTTLNRTSESAPFSVSQMGTIGKEVAAPPIYLGLPKDMNVCPTAVPQP